MSGEIQVASTTGRTLYALLRSSTGTIYNGSTFEVYTLAHYATYPLTMTEQGTTGYYLGTMPAVAAGIYAIDLRARLGVSAAATDPSLGGAAMAWNGVAEVSAANVVVASNGDKTGYALTSGEHTAVTADAASALATAGVSAARMQLLDATAGTWSVFGNVITMHTLDGAHTFTATFDSISAPTTATVVQTS